MSRRWIQCLCAERSSVTARQQVILASETRNVCGLNSEEYHFLSIDKIMQFCENGY
jgi:hypothetical protein